MSTGWMALLATAAGFHRSMCAVWAQLLPLLPAREFMFVAVLVAGFGTYVLGALPWAICDATGLLKKYRVQKDKWPSKRLMRKAALQVLFNNIVINVAASWVSSQQMADTFDMRTETIPSFGIMAVQMLAFSIVEDSLFYAFHRASHHRAVYKYVHKQHHEFHATTCWAATYAHPIEYLLVDIVPTMAGPYVLAMLSSVHAVTLLGWLVVRMLETLDGHSGYELPLWFPHKLIGGSGAEYHDFHHSKNQGNFGSFWGVWDKICKTDARYYKFQAAQESNPKYYRNDEQLWGVSSVKSVKSE